MDNRLNVFNVSPHFEDKVAQGYVNLRLWGNLALGLRQRTNGSRVCRCLWASLFVRVKRTFRGPAGYVMFVLNLGKHEL